jgi:hypothetical protein
MKSNSSKTITITHDRRINHYVVLKKGDSITFKYRNYSVDKRNRPHSWEGTLSANHRSGYEKKLNEQYILNLFEMSDIDTSKARTFKDYFALLQQLFNDENIGYVDIYKKLKIKDL